MSHRSPVNQASEPPLSSADFEYHIAACLRDSIGWHYRQKQRRKPIHATAEATSASLPMQFPDLHRRVRCAYIQRRAVEREAASSPTRTAALRAATARKRRVELRLSRAIRRPFAWSGGLQRAFEEAVGAAGARRSPYSVLAEMRKRGVGREGDGLTTKDVRRRLERLVRRCHAAEREGGRAAEGMRGKTRLERVCELLPAMCREKPTAHLGDELMYFDAELQI